MKVCHWSLTNGSGLHGVARDLVQGESAVGLDSKLLDSMVESEAWEGAVSADVHVVHSHLPNPVQAKIRQAKRHPKIVWIGHGTPEHVFQSAVEYAQNGGYGHPEPSMLMHHWLREADAVVTFWERHAWIYRSLLPRSAKVEVLPLGVDKAFWGQGESRGKFEGSPSLFTAENPHYIKWPLDLMLCWPDVARQVGAGMAKLHAIYLPRDMHSVFYPFLYGNDAAYYGYWSPMTFDREGLRNAFQSTDYTIGLVRYGDHNQLSQQANASGAKTISYRGNPYADFWLTEGDQRGMATELLSILNGDTHPRSKTPVPDLAETVQAMIAIYGA